jgi:hypothetical protein
MAQRQHTLSRQRLSRYLRMAAYNMPAALMLYETNIQLSEALYGIVQTVEISLRNACHQELTTGYGSDQ